MRNLLCANLSRLWKSRLFWTVTVVMIALVSYDNVHSYAAMLRNAEFDGSGTLLKYGYVVTLDEMLFSRGVIYGIVAAVLVSLFTGVEYSDGTLRNKLVVGQKRTDIYFANFIACALAVIGIYVLTAAVSLVLGLLLLEDPKEPASAMVLTFGIGFMVSICHTAIFCFVAMLFSNKTHMAVISLLLAFGLLFGAIHVGNKLSEPEYLYTEALETDDTSITIYAEESEEIALTLVPNPDYISGTKRTIYEFLYDVNPTSQAGQMAGIEIVHPARAVAYDVVITGLACLAGVLVFRRKDIK